MVKTLLEKDNLPEIEGSIKDGMTLRHDAKQLYKDIEAGKVTTIQEIIAAAYPIAMEAYGLFNDV